MDAKVSHDYGDLIQRLISGENIKIFANNQSEKFQLSSQFFESSYLFDRMYEIVVTYNPMPFLEQDIASSLDPNFKFERLINNKVFKNEKEYYEYKNLFQEKFPNFKIIGYDLLTTPLKKQGIVAKIKDKDNYLVLAYDGNDTDKECRVDYTTSITNYNSNRNLSSLLNSKQKL